MVLLFPSEEQYRKFNPDEFPGLPSTITYGIDTDGAIQKQLREQMKLKGSTLPHIHHRRHIQSCSVLLTRLYHRHRRANDESCP